MKLITTLFLVFILATGLLITYGVMTSQNSFIAKDTSTPSNPPSNGNSGTDNAGIIGAVTNLPGAIGTSIVQNIKKSASEIIQNSAQQMLGSTFAFVFQNPNLKSFCIPFTTIMNLVTGLYALFLLIIGLYFILGSLDVEDRIRAKKYLRNFIIVIAVLSLSFYFYQLLLGVNNYITGYISQNFVVNNVFNFPEFGSSALVILLLIFCMLAMLVVGLSLIIRYILVSFFLLTFPIAIVMFFVPFTRDFAKTILKVTFITIFMTSIDALFLFASTFLFTDNTIGGILKLVAIIASFLLLSLLNTALYLWALIPAFEQVQNIQLVQQVSEVLA